MRDTDTGRPWYDLLSEGDMLREGVRRERAREQRVRHAMAEATDDEVRAEFVRRFGALDLPPGASTPREAS